MAPRILTFQDLVDKKSVKLVKLKLKLRSIVHEQRRLCDIEIFLEELSHKFVEKLARVRQTPNPMFETEQEIYAYQFEVIKLEDKITVIEMQIEDLIEQKTILERNLNESEQDLRNFVATGRRPQN